MATARIRVRADELSFQITAREKAVREEIRAAQRDAAEATLPKVVRKSPVDQGMYKARWKVREKAVGTGDPITQLYNDAPYAGIIERGTRPFWPPFQPIFEWAQRKAGDLGLAGVVNISAGAFRAGGKRFRGRSSLKDEDLEALRRFVNNWRRKVARVGMKPKRVMQRTLPFARKALKRSFEKRLEAILGKKF